MPAPTPSPTETRPISEAETIAGLPVTSHNVRSALAETLSHSADWRCSLVERFPDDDRNAAASEILAQMSQAASEGDPELLSWYRATFLEGGDGDTDAVEVEAELLRNVGFSFTPNGIDEYLSELRDRVAFSQELRLTGP